MRLGIISDTHGVLHPRVAEIFDGVDQIFHAGDIGDMRIIEQLETIAPVTFVPGNVDGVEDAVRRTEVEGLRIALTHILPRPSELSRHVRISMMSESADLVIFGHSHLPHDESVDGCWYFNPASAGPRRFDYPTSIGMIEKQEGRWVSRHIALDSRSVDALRQRMNQLSG